MSAFFMWILKTGLSFGFVIAVFRYGYYLIEDTIQILTDLITNGFEHLLAWSRDKLEERRERREEMRRIKGKLDKDGNIVYDDEDDRDYEVK